MFTKKLNFLFYCIYLNQDKFLNTLNAMESHPNLPRLNYLQSVSHGCLRTFFKIIIKSLFKVIQKNYFINKSKYKSLNSIKKFL